MSRMRIYLTVFFLIGVLVSALALDENINEENEDFEKPCGSSKDIDVKCVREYFRNHGHCSVIHRPDNKPVYRKHHVSYLSDFNTTVVDTHSTLKQLQGVIKKFYINKKTRNLVMTVYMKACIFESKMAHFHFHRRGQEPLVLSDAINATYPPTDLTAVIPLNYGLITRRSLQKAVISAYMYEATFPMYFGPKIKNSDDPEAAAIAASMFKREGTLLKEVFLTEGRSNFMGYLQKYVCDFRIPPS